MCYSCTCNAGLHLSPLLFLSLCYLFCLVLCSLACCPFSVIWHLDVSLCFCVQFKQVALISLYTSQSINQFPPIKFDQTISIINQFLYQLIIYKWISINTCLSIYLSINLLIHLSTSIYIYICMRESYLLYHLFAFWRVRKLYHLLENFILTAATSKSRVRNCTTAELEAVPLLGSHFAP